MHHMFVHHICGFFYYLLLLYLCLLFFKDWKIVNKEVPNMNLLKEQRDERREVAEDESMCNNYGRP